MRWSSALALIIVVIIVVLAFAIFVLDIDLFQTGKGHGIVFHYDDGTTSDFNPFLWITYDNKHVEYVEYKVLGSGLDLSNYNPYFETDLVTYQLDPNDAVRNSWVVNIFSLLNYTLDDGDYTITLNPSGTATQNGEVLSLDVISFKVHLEDNRQINLVFG